jgi:hypothetical protein
MTRFLARIDLRQSRRWAASIVLLALAGGAALTAAEAARRTDTAFTRALSAGHASDAVVNADTFTYDASKLAAQRNKGLRLLDAVDRLPMVVAHGRFGGGNVFVMKGDKVDDRFSTGSAFGLVAYDNRIGRTVSTLRLSAGRLARPDRADEITITRKTAELTGWKVGSRVTNLRVFAPTEFDENGLPLPGKGTRLSMRLVGIGELPDELLLSEVDRQPRVFLTPAFEAHFPDSVFYLNEWVRLRNGHADLTALRQAVARINRAAPDIDMPISPTGDHLVKVNQANDPLVNGLWFLAALDRSRREQMITRSSAPSARPDSSDSRWSSAPSWSSRCSPQSSRPSSGGCFHRSRRSAPPRAMPSLIPVSRSISRSPSRHSV